MGTAVSSEVELLLEQFHRLLHDHADRPSDQFFTRDFESLWRILDGGGWIDIAAPAAVGGGGLDLGDLARFAELWGHYLIPLPFLATVLARADPGRESDRRPRTFSVFDGAACVAPFGSHQDVRVVAGLPDSGNLIEVHGKPADDFTPSLCLAAVTASTEMDEHSRAAVRALLIAEAVGAASATLEQAVEYAGQRTAYGRTIQSFQAMRHWLADMARDVEFARSAVVWATRTMGPTNYEAATTGIQLARRVATRSIQVFGGMGFTWELGIHFYIRHIVGLRQLVPPEPDPVADMIDIA